MGGGLVRMRYNRSAWPLENNSKTGWDIHHATVLSDTSDCSKVVFDILPSTMVVLCTTSISNHYQLSLYSTVGLKNIVLDRVDLMIEGVATMMDSGGVLVVHSPIVAILYTIYDTDGEFQLIELDIIDIEDIAGTICDVLIVNNSTTTYSPS